MDSIRSYDERLKELQTWQAFLEKWLRNNKGAPQEQKIKILLEIITSKRRTNIDNLETCANFLRKFKAYITRNSKAVEEPQGISTESLESPSKKRAILTYEMSKINSLKDSVANKSSTPDANKKPPSVEELSSVLERMSQANTSVNGDDAHKRDRSISPTTLRAIDIVFNKSSEESASAVAGPSIPMTSITNGLNTNATSSYPLPRDPRSHRSSASARPREEFTRDCQDRQTVAVPDGDQIRQSPSQKDVVRTYGDYRRAKAQREQRGTIEQNTRLRDESAPKLELTKSSSNDNRHHRERHSSSERSSHKRSSSQRIESESKRSKTSQDHNAHTKRATTNPNPLEVAPSTSAGRVSDQRNKQTRKTDGLAKPGIDIESTSKPNPDGKHTAVTASTSSLPSSSDSNQLNNNTIKDKLLVLLSKKLDATRMDQIVKVLETNEADTSRTSTVDPTPGAAPGSGTSGSEPLPDQIQLLGQNEEKEEDSTIPTPAITVDPKKSHPTHTTDLPPLPDQIRSLHEQKSGSSEDHATTTPRKRSNVDIGEQELINLQQDICDMPFVRDALLGVNGKRLRAKKQSNVMKVLRRTNTPVNTRTNTPVNRRSTNAPANRRSTKNAPDNRRSTNAPDNRRSTHAPDNRRSTKNAPDNRRSTKNAPDNRRSTNAPDNRGSTNNAPYNRRSTNAPVNRRTNTPVNAPRTAPPVLKPDNKISKSTIDNTDAKTSTITTTIADAKTGSECTSSKKPSKTTLLKRGKEIPKAHRERLLILQSFGIKESFVRLTRQSVEDMIAMDSQQSASDNTIDGDDVTKKTTVPKNTDKNHHALNAEARQCVLCKQKPKFLSSHYASTHEAFENYGSRVPPELAEKLHSGWTLDPAIRQEKGKIRQFCIFCGTWNVFYKQNWVRHFGRHTGEYQYRCDACGIQHYNYTHHCPAQMGRTTTSTHRITPQFERATMSAFVCKLCNYAQFERSTVEKHLVGQHDISALKAEAGGQITEVFCLRDRSATASRLETPPVTFRAVPRDLHRKIVANQPFIKLKRLRLDADGGVVAHLGDDAAPTVPKTESEDGQLQMPKLELQSPTKIVDANSSGPIAADQRPIPYGDAQTIAAEVPALGATTCEAPTTENDDDDEWEDCSTDAEEDDNSDEVTTAKSTASVVVGGQEKSPDSNATAVPPAVQSPLPVVPNESPMDVQSMAPSSSCNDAHRTEASTGDSPVVDVPVESAIDEPVVLVDDSPVGSPVVNNSSADDTNNANAEMPREIVIIRTINRIDNVGYTSSQANLVVCCLMAKCGFETTFPNQLSTHLLAIHKDTIWPGYCYMCDKQISDNSMMWTLEAEMHHMLEIHILRKNMCTTASQTGGTQTAVAGGLNVRRLPGDTLSKRRNVEQPGNAEDNRLATALTKVPNVQAQKVVCVLPGHMQIPSSLQITRVVPAPPLPAASIQQQQSVPTSELRISNVYSLSDPARAQIIAGTSTSTAAAPAPAPITLVAKSPVKPMRRRDSICLPRSNISATSSAAKPAAPAPTGPARKSIIMRRSSVAVGAPRPNILKPWLPECVLWKSPEDARAMLILERNLYATYKCMAINCRFTCKNSSYMFAHWKRHEHDEAQRLMRSASSPPLPAAERSWLECAYCELHADTETALLQHIIGEHEPCLFQCAFCFYRTCAAHNVIEHQLALHANKGAQLVLACPGKTKSLYAEMQLIEKLRAQFVAQLQCDRNCPKRFNTFEAYQEHLLVGSRSNHWINCSQCNVRITSENALAHQLFHGIGRYACVYCPFGASQPAAICTHMWRSHPTRFPYVMCRVHRDRILESNTSAVEPMSDALHETAIAYVGKAVQNTLIKKCPLGEKELNVLSPELCQYIRESPELRYATNIAIEVPKTAETTAESLRLEQIVRIEDVEAFFNDALPQILAQRAKRLAGRVVHCTKGRTVVPKQSVVVSSAANPPIPTMTVFAVAAGPSATSVNNIPVAQQRPPPDATSAGPWRLVLRTGSLTGAVSAQKMLNNNEIAVQQQPITSTSSGAAITSTLPAQPQPSTSAAAPAAAARVTEITNSATAICAAPALTDKELCAIYGAALHLIQQTGFTGHQLYRCAQGNCTVTCGNRREFNVHMLQHSGDTQFRCSSCVARTRTVEELIKHVQLHGLHSFFCYACTKTSPTHLEIMRHIREAHSIQMDLIRYQLIPNRRCGLYVVFPRNSSDATLREFRLSLLGRAISADILKVKVFVPMEKRFYCIICNHTSCDATQFTAHIVSVHLHIGCNSFDFKCPHCADTVHCTDAGQFIDHLQLHGECVFKCSHCQFHSQQRERVEQHIGKQHAGAGRTALCQQLMRMRNVATVDDGTNAETGSSYTTQETIHLKSGRRVRTLDQWNCMLCPQSFLLRVDVALHARQFHNVHAQYTCLECSCAIVSKESMDKHVAHMHQNGQPANGQIRVRCFYEHCRTYVSDVMAVPPPTTTTTTTTTTG